MTVRVRFAPSPTGYLHVGGARTALYNYLFAKSQGGSYILRVEDTDEARSTREFEASQIADLKWLGIEHSEGPDVGGPYGPYRQSERGAIYNEYSKKLLDSGHAYYCFCTEETLEAKKKIAEEQNLAPHYDGTCLKLSKDEVLKRKSSGEPAVIRFKAPHKSYTLQDHCRGEVVFQEGMVGDFVIVRSDGVPVFNFCNVLDDMLMKITHVIRAEEHLNNTLRQLMIYEAYKATPPEYAHISLLIGKDRQKLSKRHGATSVKQYMEETYLPEGLNNYLSLLGWSHPQEKDIFTMAEIVPLFSIDRFNKSPAIFDIEKCNYTNAQHLRALPPEVLRKEVDKVMPKDHPYHKQSVEWKDACLHLYKEHIQIFKELPAHLDHLFNEKVNVTPELKEIFTWETTPKISEYLMGEINKTGNNNFTQADFDAWGNHIKSELKIKGKQLFMGMRGVLTGEAHGPDLKFIIPLTPVNVLKTRMKNIAEAVK